METHLVSVYIIHPGILTGLFPLGFSTRILYAFLISPHTCYINSIGTGYHVGFLLILLLYDFLASAPFSRLLFRLDLF